MNLNELIKSAVNGRSDFNLGFQQVTTCEFGDLMPVIMQEMLPSDTFSGNIETFVRMSPLVSPTLGRVHGFINYFFVPCRILSSSFNDSLSGGVDGKSVENFPFTDFQAVHKLIRDMFQDPTTDEAKAYLRDINKLFSNLGLPTFNPEQMTDETARVQFSLLPFAAYNRVYADYYFPYGLGFDSNIRPFITQDLNGVYSVLDDQKWYDYFTQKHACFGKDYFTTAFTSPQRGNESEALVKTPTSSQNPAFANIGTMEATDEGYDSRAIDIDGDTSGNNIIGRISSYAERLAWAVQKYMERNNIAGARHFEQVLARFGVKQPAARLDRSEYIGGNDFYIGIGDIASHTNLQGDMSNPYELDCLGALAGKGIGDGNGGFSYTADEHGFLVGLVHIVPDSTLVQGIDRMWTRKTRFDYFTPEMEDTGMQPVYNKEAFMSTTDPVLQGDNPEGVFGYVPRYAEYKWHKDILGGDLRVDFEKNGTAATMQDLHMFRLVNKTPVLNPAFCECDQFTNSFNRIFQYNGTEYDHLVVWNQVKLNANRPMLGYAEGALAFANDNLHGRVQVPYAGMRL